MSTGARSVLSKHCKLVLSRWPKDALRPETQLQDVLTKRLEASSAAGTSELGLRQVNALYSLVGDRYKTKYRITGSLLQPQSNPTYYTDLVVELEEGPRRSWLGRIAKRLSGMIRLQ